MTVKLLRSLKGCRRLSVTCTPMTLVLGPWSSVGVQLNTPVTGSRVTPLGADVRLKLRLPVDGSETTAVFVTTSVVNSLILCPGGTVSTGGTKLRSLVMRIPSRRISSSSPWNEIVCGPTVNGNTLWLGSKLSESGTSNPKEPFTSAHCQAFLTVGRTSSNRCDAVSSAKTLNDQTDRSRANVLRQIT